MRASEPRRFDDIDTTRQLVLDDTLGALQSFEPVSYGATTLRLTDVEAGKAPDLSYAAHKRALLGRGTIGTPVYGTWVLERDGEELDRKKKLLALAPTLTHRGTYIRNGVEYALANQARLRPGVFTHRKRNGEIESHFNTAVGTGKQFRVRFAPETGRFFLRTGQANLPIVPILKALGAEDKTLFEALGKDLYAANTEKIRPGVLARALRDFGVRDVEGDNRSDEEKLREELSRFRYDPDATARSAIGRPYDRLSSDALMDSMTAILKLHRGDIEPDNRDGLAYQRVVGHEDLFRERIKNDAGRVVKSLTYKLAKRGNLDQIPAGIFNKHIDQVLLSSGLASPPEETNPTEIYDQLSRVVRLGEGAIPSVEAVPDEARNVQPSYAGYIDGIRTPESSKVGVDLRFVDSALKGRDGRIYAPMIDARSGKSVSLDNDTAADSIIAFPGEMEEDDDVVLAVAHGKLQRVPRDRVDYIMPRGDSLFAMQSKLIPGISGDSGGRVFLGAKFISQALPLVHREAPLVQTGEPGEESYERQLGRRIGAVSARGGGVVTNVTDDDIEVQGEDGKKRKYSIANYVPYNRRTMLKHTPRVEIGQAVEDGQLLATSNMTDDEGTLALGTNLNVAYVPFIRGGSSNYEDAITLSESGAKKLVAEQMYTKKLDRDGGEPDKKRFTALFPAVYKKEQLKQIDDDGTIKPGTTVQKGDPVILATSRSRPKKTGMLSGGKPRYVDNSVVWDHDAPGFVTDVAAGPRGLVVAIKAENPAHVGDKMAGRFGDKHIISSILPDHQMPTDEDGNPFDALVNPFGIISRGNPIQSVEAAWGRIAAKDGKPINIAAFSKSDFTRRTLEELKSRGMSSEMDIFDPVLNRKIPKVSAGKRFYMRLHHLAESKVSGRGDAGGHTAEGAPAKGGDESAPRFGLMELNALLSAGATNVLDDANIVRGHRNEEYWRAIRMGYAPPKPKASPMLNKFLSLLAASGVNVQQDGSKLNIMAMTDDMVDELAQGEITEAETVRLPDLEPVKGGLFDRGITGGHGGDRFAKIELGTKIPNPVMEDPIRKLLDLTESQLRDILAGKTQFQGKSGPEAIEAALRRIDVERGVTAAKEKIRTGARTARDKAIKKLRILTMFQETGLKPQEMLITKLPVLPPAHRPISMMNDVPLVNGSNMLYKDLLQARGVYRDLSRDLGKEHSGDELLALYDAAKAVVGLGDPINRETQQRKAKGLLSVIFGSGGPKTGLFQRKLMGGTVNLGGRAVITPDPRLDMDHVAIPEKSAWKVYSPFIMKRLVGRGLKPLEAAKAVKEHASVARDAMLEEMEHRPVMINRAPSLHRYSILGAWPVLSATDSLRISPQITKQLNADFDGNCVIYTSMVMMQEAGRLRSLQIGEFPRVGEPVKDRNGADVYAVPPGLQVLSYDVDTGKQCFADVTHFTHEASVPCVEVRTSSHAVGVSDNESLAVFDPDTGRLKKVAPRDSLGGLCPVVRRSPQFGTYGSFDLGWWYGVIIADGWRTDRTVGYSKSDPKRRARVEQLARELICKDFKTYEYLAEKTEENGKYADSAKIHMNGRGLVNKTLDILAAPVPDDERAACYKHIPPFLLDEGSEHCLFGLLCGLLDGDASMTWLNSKKKPQFSALLHTSSPFLRDSALVLGSRLGIRIGVTTSPARGHSREAYTLTVSSVDLYRHRANLRFIGEENITAWHRLLENPPTKDDRDIIPLSRAEITAIRGICLGYKTDKQMQSLYVAVAKGRVARASLQRLFAIAGSSGLEALQRRVENVDVIWEPVKSVTPTGCKDVYDLAVLGTKVFAVNNGLVVYDTMSFHVPASEEARREVIEKMMPSKQLIDVKNFKAHFMPRQEYQYGLFAASRPATKTKRKAPKIFESAKAAIAAFQRGEINMDDNVIIPGSKPRMVDLDEALAGLTGG
ncbi:MAG: hypothetical protein WC992_00305 [Acholeplasmataceae bacterium]